MSWRDFQLPLLDDKADKGDNVFRMTAAVSPLSPMSLKNDLENTLIKNKNVQKDFLHDVGDKDDNASNQTVFAGSTIDQFYPDQLDIDTCQMILDEVRQLSGTGQTNWWLALSAWLNTGAGDLDWRCSVFELLSTCWNTQPSQDFLIAKQIFAGPGSRIISDGQVTRNPVVD